MENTTLPDYERGLNFEKMWACLHETSEKYEREKKERDEKYEREKKERDTEYARQQKERDEKAARSMEELEKIVKRNSRQMGDLHNKFGKMAEHLVAPGIAKRFNDIGCHFDEMARGGHKILDERGEKTRAEIDVLLENGDCVVAVEVKVNPKIKDIEHHIKRIEILREVRQKKNDSRKILGAIAGAIYEQAVKEATIEAGMYVLEQSGDTMKMDIPEGFTPREW